MKHSLSFALIFIGMTILIFNGCNEITPNDSDTKKTQTDSLRFQIQGNWVQVAEKYHATFYDGSPDTTSLYPINPAREDSLHAFFVTISSDTLTFIYNNEIATKHQIEYFTLAGDTVTYSDPLDKIVTMEFNGDTLFIHHENDFASTFDEGYVDHPSYGKITSGTLSYCLLPFEGSIPPSNWPDSVAISY